MVSRSIRDYQTSWSPCANNLKRMYLGKEVVKLFKETGIEETELLISIIDGLLTKYRTDIPTKFDSLKLIGKIYSEARELYNMKSKSQK